MLEAPVASMVALQLRDRPTTVTANVRFAHVRPEAWSAGGRGDRDDVEHERFAYWAEFQGDLVLRTGR